MYKCVYCGETKPGEFQRPFSAGNGWDRGTHQPVWVCEECSGRRVQAKRLGEARGLLQQMHDDLTDVYPTNYVEWLRRAREWLN